MVEVKISVGELLDKISILEIKKSKITDSIKLKNINHELEFLYEKSSAIIFVGKELLIDNLKTVNMELWDIEDSIRRKEFYKEFDQDFIDIARSVYTKNDKRYALKSRINELANSDIIEEKCYV